MANRAGAALQNALELQPKAAPDHQGAAFLDENTQGIAVEDAAHLADAGQSKRRKAQRYRDLTCPRVRTSQLGDGTKIVTVGSHVLVYPASSTKATEGAKAHPKGASAQGAVTTFEEHEIGQFSDDSFKHYSLGVGLYFKGVRYLALVFLAISLITLPSLVLCILGNPKHGSDSGLYFEKTTTGNFGALLTQNSTAETVKGSLPSARSRTDIVFIIACIDALICLILLGFNAWLTNWQETESRAYSKREITVQKYSVEVRNLPPYYHDRYKLALWFQERFGPVVDVAIAFDQHDLLNVYRLRGILRKDIDMAVSHGETGRLDGLYEQLKDIDNRIDDIQKDLGHRKTLGAFVTFEHQESRIACEKAFSNMWLKNLAGTVSKDAKINASKSLLFGSGQRVLKVKQASEPSNVLFKNLKYSRQNKFFRRLLTFCATGVLILISVIAVYLAQRYSSSAPSTQMDCPLDISAENAQLGGDARDCYCYQLGSAALNTQRGDGVDCGSWLAKYALSRSFSVLAVITIVFVNFVLKSVIKRMTQFEKHDSASRLQESVTNKLFVGLFLNTAIVLLVVNTKFDHVATNLGLTIAFDGKFDDFTYDWFVQVGANIILTMVLNTVNPHFLPFLKVPLSKWRRESKYCCLPNRSSSQNEWNTRFAGEDFELAERYAVLLNTLFVTLLYSGGMPLLLPIAAVTFAFTYFMDKISFLRLYRIPPRYDHTLAMYTTTLLPYAVFIHCAFCVWFFTSPIFKATNTMEIQSIYLAQYKPSTLSDRMSQWQALPSLIMMILVAGYIVIFRWGVSLYHMLAEIDPHAELTADASKFVPYSVARRTVTLETYHPHGSPFFHDAFIRTPSRKMMKIPTPLHLLQEEARQDELRKQHGVADKKGPAAKGSPAAISSGKAKKDDQFKGVAPAPGTYPDRPSVSITMPGEEEDSEKSISKGTGHLAKKARSMGIEPHTDMRATNESIAAAKAGAKHAAEIVRTSMTPLAKNQPQVNLLGVNGRSRQAHPPMTDAQEALTRPAFDFSGASATATAAAAEHVASALDAQKAKSKKNKTKVEVVDNSRSASPKDSPSAPTRKGEVTRVSQGSDQPVMVLDLPDSSVATQQHQIDDMQTSIEAADTGVVRNRSDEDGEDAMYCSHLQHSTHVSMPANDPMLNEVAPALHRMANSIAKDQEKAGKKSKSPAAAKKKKKHASGAVADSSVVDIPQEPTVGTFENEPQLVPTACPNVECGRVLELVDTGVPQLYHCPFCSTAFIM